MSTAKFMAETLRSYGVDHVFFMDAILRRTLAEMENVGIRRILTHSEKSAAYMADGYSRIAHKPGICMAQSVGAANLAAGLQDPYLANSSVIAITGRQVAMNQYRNAYQELPHEPMFAAVTKFSACAESPEQLGILLRQAFREATTGDIRPVHLDVAGNTGAVLDQSEGSLDVIPEPEYGRLPAWRPRPDAEALARAVQATAQAKRPLIVAGIGAMVSDAGGAIRALAEKQDIPVAGALDARTFIPAGHPLNAGIVGTYSHDYGNKLAAEADCIVFIGCDTGDQVTNNWTLSKPGAVIIQIDANAAELGRNYAGTIGVVGDPRATLIELETLLPPVQRPEWVGRLAALVAEWDAENAPLLSSSAIPIRPERICAELSEWLPADAIVVADTGYSSHWAGTFIDMKHEGQTFIRAAGSLGWAFPAALGAKCAAPDRTVVCFTGDGGFMYHLTELETAKRWGIKTITIVNNNHRLAQGLRNLRIAYQDRNAARMPEIFVYEELDFAEVARSFGCTGIRVTEPAKLADALKQADMAEGPVVIDIVTDPEILAPTSWVAPS